MSRRLTWILLALALGLVLVGTPGREAAYERRQAEFAQDVTARTYHIDPAELVGLMHNNRISLAILDVRAEADFNLFHLRDARRMTPRLLSAPELPTLAPLTVSVVVSNDEASANESWKRLRVLGVKNVYVLAGGINGWLDLFRPNDAAFGMPGDETLQHVFAAALGSRIPAAAPALESVAERTFEKKVKAPKPTPSAGGGCG